MIRILDRNELLKIANDRENKIEEKEEIRIDLISDTAFEVNFFD